MREDRTWGGSFEIAAMTELYQRPIEIYEQSIVPQRLTPEVFPQFDLNTPIRIQYVHGNHYQSITSANHAETVMSPTTAGVIEDLNIAYSRGVIRV